MYQISPKIYYYVKTGEILVITNEFQSEEKIELTTKEEDIEIYSQLKSRSIDEIDYIDLEYGTLATILKNVKSYKVNLETKKLEVNYYTKDELAEIQKQIENLNNRTLGITEYIQTQDEKTLSDFEDYILEQEKNKILGGI